MKAPLRAMPLALYPERPDAKPDFLEEVLKAVQGRGMAALASRRARLLSKIILRMDREADAARQLPTSDLLLAARRAGLELRRSRMKDEAALAKTFALLREACERVTGKRPYDVQIVGAHALLKGMVAHMATGEGKTLTASLAAAAAALAGLPVHVVTVNDYLAARDAESMSPLYTALGLSVGVVVAGKELAERQEAYRSDIVYCTNKELAFDYLRDRMILGQKSGDLRLRLGALADPSSWSDMRLRGLHFAIVDEADSVLVDEARTPLIISAQAESQISREVVEEVLRFARELEPDVDYRIASEHRLAILTEAGCARAEECLAALPGVWGGALMREELARQALSALHLHRRDEHYVVREGKLEIVDESTGRVMKDRFWGDGLHQMVEAKEGCELSPRRTTIARMTYQRFFRRYGLLSGMTGTAMHVADEFWTVYSLKVARIRTHRPLARIVHPDRVLDKQSRKWRLVLARVRELHAAGVPVLIGTRSVASSEAAGRLLAENGLVATVLNATQDHQESAIVAQAGQRGRITVVTNMAGRGTDIQLGPGVEALGGLHVVMTERHEARRIDDQLAGRAGRQGEPGSFEAILSLEDSLFTQDCPPFTRAVGHVLGGLLGERGRRLALALAQRTIERMHSRMRRDLLKADRNLVRILAFSGRSE